MIKTRALFVVFLLSILPVNGARPASFDCSKASLPLERMVCGDKSLSDLDDQLAKAWSEALGGVSDAGRSSLVAEQRQWLKGRATSCSLGDGASASQCLASYYSRRIAALKSSRPIPPTPGVQLEARPKPAQDQKVRAYLEEVRKQFTIGGQPISPGVLHDLSTWISDKQASVVMIDVLTAAASNQYYTGDTKIINGWTGVDHKEESGGTSRFSYNFAGSLDNGLLLVQTRSSGGGTSVFENLLILDVVGDRGLAFDDTPYDRVCLKVIREVALGDRVGARIERQGNVIYTVTGGVRAMLAEGKRP